MTITVMIPTRNRCEELRRTCTKLRELRPLPDEVLIWADACTDETVAMVRSEFPGFRLVVSPHAVGSVQSRDRMLRHARGELVVSLDDDSYPLHNNFVSRLCEVAAAHPEAAVLVFPELRDAGQCAAPDKTDQSPGHYVAAYANCAAAMRREFYLAQPGFVDFFRHMYEEPDYALQCYAAGAAIWFEPTLIVRHRQSPRQRRPMQRHHSNARNELWSVWLRCPWPWVAPVTVYRVARQLVYACSESWKWAIEEPLWWTQALKGLPRCAAQRQPVNWKVYLRWMWLARRPVHRAEQLRLIVPEKIRAGKNRARPGACPAGQGSAPTGNDFRSSEPLA